MRNNILQKKLEEQGFNIRERNIDKNIILQCFVTKFDTFLTFGIIEENNKFKIWNANEQISTPKYFDNENQLIEFIKENFPVEN